MPTSPDSIQGPLVFAGVFRPQLDGGGRVTIPSRWRSAGLQELFIIKSDGKRCLSAMPMDELRAAGERAASKSPTLADHESFKEFFFSSAAPCAIDSQGRMVLPGELCQHAGIVKEVVLAGSDRKFNLWSPEEYEKWRAAAATNYNNVMKNLGL